MFFLFPPLLTLTEPFSRLCLGWLLKSVEALETLPGAIFKIPVPSKVWVVCLWIFAVIIGKTTGRGEAVEGKFS